jgi:hypothetical protein
MNVCPRVSVLCCPVSVEALRRADLPSKESYQSVSICRSRKPIRVGQRSAKDCKYLFKNKYAYIFHAASVLFYTIEKYYFKQSRIFFEDVVPHTISVLCALGGTCFASISEIHASSVLLLLTTGRRIRKRGCSRMS